MAGWCQYVLKDGSDGLLNDLGCIMAHHFILLDYHEKLE